jgi:hypothetical protein
VTDVFFLTADFLFGSIINTINKHLCSINKSIHQYIVMAIAARVRAGRAAIKERLTRHLPKTCYQSLPRAELSMALTGTQGLWSFALEISQAR